MMAIELPFDFTRMSLPVRQAHLMYFADASPSARVYLSDRALLSNLPEGIDIVSADGRSAVLYSARPGYVRNLYESGALLVLPVRRQSCLTLSAGDQSAEGSRRMVNSI